MKINFLNDESHKFDGNSNDDLFEENITSQSEYTTTTFDESLLDDEPSESIQSEFGNEFSNKPDTSKKVSRTEEHDIIIDESKTHRKLRLISLFTVLLLSAIYLSIDYIDFEKLFSKSSKEEQKEYIETITPDSTGKNASNLSKAKKQEEIKEETKKIKPKQVAKSITISKEILDASTDRMNTLNTIQSIASFSFVSAKLQQIYYLNNTVYFEVFSTNRLKLGSFSKALSNQISQVKLTKSKNFNSSGVSATFKYPPSKTAVADFGDIQNQNTILNIIKQNAQDSGIKITESTIEKSLSRSKTPIFIRATGSLKAMSKFIDTSNQSLNNVSLSKLSLSNRNLDKSSGNIFLLSMRITILK